MQHLYAHGDTEMYPSSNHMHNHYHHVQYQQENRSISPQQSSPSEGDETSTPPPPSSMPTSSVVTAASAAAVHRGVNVNVSSKIVKKKKQAKKKRKDPNEPQKPVSPYALFFRDTQNDIKKKLANPSFGEISKVVAHMWENIEPEVKEQYKRKAATAKKEYLKQLAAYRAVQVSHQAPSMHHLLGNNGLTFDPNTMPMTHQQKPYHNGALTGSMMTDNNNILSSTSHPHPHFASYQQAQHHHHHHHHPNTIQQQYCPSAQGQFNNYHYVNNYVQDPTMTNYNNDNSSMHFSNHYDPHGNYSSYDSNNNNHHFIEHSTSHQQHYGLLRPAVESELYASYYNPSNNELDSSSTSISSIANENLLHNLNHSMINHPLHYTDLSSTTMSTSSNNGLMEKHYEFVNSSTPTLNELDHNPKEEDRSALPISNENNFHWNQTTCLATQW